ncbi:unnamed protein product, partial [Amoebophrya sp. A25]
EISPRTKVLIQQQRRIFSDTLHRDSAEAGLQPKNRHEEGRHHVPSTASQQLHQKAQKGGVDDLVSNSVEEANRSALLRKAVDQSAGVPLWLTLRVSAAEARTATTMIRLKDRSPALATWEPQSPEALVQRKPSYGKPPPDYFPPSPQSQSKNAQTGGGVAHQRQSYNIRCDMVDQATSPVRLDFLPRRAEIGDELSMHEDYATTVLDHRGADSSIRGATRELNNVPSPLGTRPPGGATTPSSAHAIYPPMAPTTPSQAVGNQFLEQNGEENAVAMSPARLRRVLQEEHDLKHEAVLSELRDLRATLSAEMERREAE